MSVITKAKELIETVGKEDTIKMLEKKIEELGEPKNFEEICKLSGLETALNYVKGEIK